MKKKELKKNKTKQPKKKRLGTIEEIIKKKSMLEKLEKENARFLGKEKYQEDELDEKSEAIDDKKEDVEIKNRFDIMDAIKPDKWAVVKNKEKEELATKNYEEKDKKEKVEEKNTPEPKKEIKENNNSKNKVELVEINTIKAKPGDKQGIESRNNKNQKIIEKYEIEADDSKVIVEITKIGSEINYILKTPLINLATSKLLNDIRDELITATTISMKELTDPNALNSIKKRFMDDSSKLLKYKLPNLDAKTENVLIGKLIQDMLGLGDIEFLINDPSLEEIVINSAGEPIRVYAKKYGWLETNIVPKKEEDIINYSNIIARRVGRQINILNPLLDAHLTTGDRINAVLYPINTKGNTITIRKFARDPYTIIDLIKNKTCDLNTISLLWLAIEYEMNVLISGGTASGKTVFLNACLPFIPPNQRIISIEDTRELMLPKFLYWTPLVTRTANPEGKGEVSMLNLLINSLRMRPDRIILGEMRKHEEAMVLFEAMHTGHSVYATVHADSAAETISRLTNPPMSVPPNLLKSVNLNVIMFRDRRKGIRRILQIAEFEAEKDEARANILYRWSPEKDEIVKHGESSRFFEDVGRHTGMSETEIKKILEEKKKILAWLVKNGIRSLEEFGKVTNLYYRDKEALLSIINKNEIKKIIG